MNLTKTQKQFVVKIEERFGKAATVNREQVTKIAEENSFGFPYWLTKAPYRIGLGEYKVPALAEEIVESPVAELQAKVLPFQPVQHQFKEDVSIPEVYPDYVPFGFYKDLRNILKSKAFYPVFVTGLSGNGKTLMVEQTCAELKRECIRVNISVETDETDLIGGPTLVNGNVINRDGPVITAMKRGAVLLIDEVDRGSSKLMCMQGILEGKPYYNKKSGEVVYPKDGFNIIATANTKGRGSDEGKYLSQILDDAFLERFPITVEQEYPAVSIEKKILAPLIDDETFIDNLIKWADVIRQTYEEGGVSEIISTRRLVHIAKAYKIFGEKMKAIELCVARFDEDTKMSFLDLYTKIDAGETLNPEQAAAPEEVASRPNDTSAPAASVPWQPSATPATNVSSDSL
jgi:MoxR-like ATPase